MDNSFHCKQPALHRPHSQNNGTFQQIAPYNYAVGTVTEFIKKFKPNLL